MIGDQYINKKLKGAAAQAAALAAADAKDTVGKLKNKENCTMRNISLITQV